MARKFLTALDLAQNELQNARVQNLAGAPGTPVKGQLWFDSTNNILKWWDGGTWVAAMGAAGAVPYDGAPTQVDPNSAAAAGASSLYSRGDHRHSANPYANVVAQTTFGLASANGSGSSHSRGDHAHGTPTHDGAAHSAIPLSSLSAPFGVVTAETTFGTSSGNGASNSAARTDHTHGNPAHVAATHSTITLDTFAAAAADLNLGGNQITNMGEPGSATDAATRNYVDNMAQGLSWKDAVRVATTANITLSGLQSIDGVTVVSNDRVLVKNQTTPSQNGIYYAGAGAWSLRTTDADTEAKLINATCWVSEGTTLADTAWTMTTNAPITVGTTGLTWVQFGAGTAYTAGTGLVLSASTFNVGAGTGITANADDVAVNFAGNGSAATASKSDHNHDAAYQYVAGNGLGLTGLTFDVKPGDGVNVASDLVGLNFGGTGASTSVSRMDHNHIGDYLTKWITSSIGGATSQVLTHNLGGREVSVEVYRNSTPWDTIECDVERTTINTVTLRFAVAPAANEYSAVIVG